jgi:CrcB protein
LLTEALILQRLAFSLEYRAAILVGFIGAFTTFSTFSLETIYLIEEGSLAKAALNIVVSVFGCLFAVWIGLLFGRTIFLYSGGIFHWNGIVVAYGLMIVNVIGAFLIGIITTILMQKVALSMEHRAAIMIILVGAYLTLSGLYLVLFLIEQGYTFESQSIVIVATFLTNSLSCLMVIWLGLFVSKQI